MLLTFEVHTGANKLTLYGLFEGLWDGGALHHVLGTEVGELNPLQQQIRDALRIENNETISVHQKKELTPEHFLRLWKGQLSKQVIISI